MPYATPLYSPLCSPVSAAERLEQREIASQAEEALSQVVNDQVEESVSALLNPMALFSQSLLKKKSQVIGESVERIFVGELHEKWQFPSDHLPIGVKVSDFRIGSWNVLNNAYMDWVTEKDSQGLNHSMISDLNSLVQSDGLTKRDLAVIAMIGSMIHSSLDMLALQECGMPFINELQKHLPANWKMVKMSEDPLREDQGLILYNAALFSYRPDLSVVAMDAYPSFPNRPIQNAVFEKTQAEGQLMRVFNAHIPGDPTLPGKEEFADYIYRHTRLDELTLALGDHNFERQEMLEAYQKAGFSRSEFEFHTPWHTNIDPYTKESKAIDHVFVKGSSSQALTPQQLMDDEHLQDTIRLLSTPRTN